MTAKRVLIVGAGPGGLTAGMILAKRGFDVSIYEKQAQVGGRNAQFEIDGYRFDIGPTFLMMRFVLDEVFAEAGRDINNYLDICQLEPMYRLAFREKTLDMSRDHDVMRDRIADAFPGEAPGFDRFLKREAARFKAMKPCLEKPYSSLTDMVAAPLLRALPHLSVGRSVYDVLRGYFRPDILRTCFCFQTKYLGMSPWECPAAFAMIPFIEHEFGVEHVRGGLSKISQAMARVVEEHGGQIHCNTPVKQIQTQNGRATGLLLENGETVQGDVVIINADFAHAMTTLFAPDTLRKYTAARLQRKRYSCSTFMLYLGVNKTYDDPHHAIYFADDYHANINDITRRKQLSADCSFYVRNAGVTDPTLAPEGKSAIYVLVPAPNATGPVDWEQERAPMRDRVLSLIKTRTGMTDIDSHIEVEKCITPADWQANDIYFGATFNLAHNLGQMLYFRPHNRFEEIDHCYLVGGGTHPGSGLPTIYESGRISANLVSQEHA